MDEVEWTEEKEGHLARLLREVSSIEQEDKRVIVFDQLRTCTGLEFTNDLSRWLAWYLEDHLGMRNAIGILSGQDDSEYSAENGDTAIQDEPIFECPEYNWCALEKIKNKDDMLKLRRLYSDLESPVLTDITGPFSFKRLTALDAEELQFFRGKSITKAIFSDGVQLRHLRVLKDYGKMMMMPVFPNPTQRAGAIIYASSISMSLVKFDCKITSLSYKDLSESFPGLLERPYIVESYSNLFRAALEKCE